VRYVANIADSRVNLVPTINPLTQLPLDMTYLSLRSLSPVHIEYLGNMGIAASMSVSLVQNNQLWGLIIFHHLSPKQPSSDLLKIMHFVSNKISANLSALALQEERLLLNKIALFKKSLLTSVLQKSEEDLLDQLSTQLMDIGNATGLILVIDGHRYVLGETPNTIEIDNLLNWLIERPEPEPEPDLNPGSYSHTYTYTFNNLSALYPAARAYTDIASGLLACTLNKSMSHCIIWLKKAEAAQKLWAGDPTKRLIKTTNGDYRLRPRNSFESLQINALNTSIAPWSMLEITSVHELSLILIKTIAYKLIIKQELADRQKLEQTITDNERVWKQAIDGTGDGVYDWDIQSNDMYYSPRWKNMLGYNEADVLTEFSTWKKLMHPDYLEPINEILQDYLAGITSQYEVEFPLRHKQGHYVWILSRGMVVSRDNLGKPIRMIGTHMDISARKRIELKLKEDRDILALSQSIANLGNWSYTPSTDTLIWSAQMYVIYGINKADFAHNLSALMALIHPEDQLLQNEKVVRILRPDGKLSYVKVYATIESGIDGQTLRIIGCSLDITESILREQQDQLHLDQLSHITRLGLMGEMATGIAHEVNQPLTATVNYASALKVLATANEPDLEKIAKVAGLVAEQALRAGKIIHRMKTFCQNHNTSSTSTDINALIKDSVLLCNSDLKKYNVTLHLELAESLPLLFIDSIKIEQVLINLISNSTEALSTKEIKPKSITISSLMLEENQLQIQVRDNGSGIEPALQEQLFMPFITTKTEGMGMGLSICRSLITAHHGTLTFDSQPGLGTCFYITLPVVK
jgi:PAS domain S-box-containing protein